MSRWQRLFQCRSPILPVVNAAPLSAPLQVLNPYSALSQVGPAIQHGLKELQQDGGRHALTEVALIAYLIGLGLNYRTARAVVESWETDQAMLGDGFLRPVAVESKAAEG